MRVRGYSLIIGVSVLSLFVIACEPKNAEEVQETPVVEEKVVADESTGKMRVIAMVNSDTILSQYDYALFLRDELTAQTLKYEGLLRQKETKLRAEMEQFQREANSLTQFEAQIRQKKLYGAQEKFQIKQEEYTRKLMEQEQRYNRDIDQAINEFLSRYCKDKPYEMVLSNADLGIIRWADESLDITKDVLKGLNVEYSEANTNEKSAE
jgi:outer membrane protein